MCCLDYWDKDVPKEVKQKLIVITKCKYQNRMIALARADAHLPDFGFLGVLHVAHYYMN
jgi:hypothetical protein